MGDQPGVSYVPGDWVAVAGVGAWLIADAAPGDATIASVWQAVRDGSDPGTVVGALDAGGDPPPSFGLVVADASGTLVVLAGAARAELDVPGCSAALACPAVARTAQYRVAGRPAAVAIVGGSPSHQAAVPIGTGVTPAARLVLRWDDDAAVSAAPGAAGVQTTVATGSTTGAAARDPGATLLPGALVSVSTAGTQIGAVNGSTRPQARAPEDGDPQTGGPADGDPQTGGPEDGDPQARGPEDGDPQIHAPADGDPQAGDPEDGTAYDHLFGKTISPPAAFASSGPAVAPAAAVDLAGSAPPADAGRPAPAGSSPVAVAATDPPTSTAHAQPPTPLSDAAPAALAPAAVPPAPGGALIDAVPGWSGGAPGSPATPSPAPGNAGACAVPLGPPGTDGDDNALTVNRAVQARLLEQLHGPGSLVAPGPTVHAVRCPTGHPNPAHAGACRSCGASIADQVPVTVPRPVLGRLRFSTGDEVTLDRSVLMGRRPPGDRTVGGERPHVLTLASPQNDISRTHLEVRIDGWHVLVTDLGSTNGTMVGLPGRAAVRLRPGEPILIEPGTVVTLPDDVSFVFEVAR